MTVRVSSLQNLPNSAWNERLSIENRGPGVGVMGLSDLKVSAGSGMGSSVAPGRARIKSNQAGAFVTDKGQQDVLLDFAEIATHSTADPTNPRLDLVYVRMQDAAIAGAVNKANIGIVAGTPNVGTTLISRTGVGSIPLGSILLADVLVPASAASSASFQYQDRRQFGSLGVISPKIYAVDQVAFYYPGNPITGIAFSATAAGYQSSIMVYLPRTITATKMRWAYSQDGTTAYTGNYNIAIYDSSGRKMAESGSVAYTGAINSVQFRAETIPSTLFEAGVYHIAFGEASTAGGVFASTVGWTVGGVCASGGPNITGFAPTGGVTMPLVLNHTEISAAGAHPVVSPVPAIVLSST